MHTRTSGEYSQGDTIRTRTDVLFDELGKVPTSTYGTVQYVTADEGGYVVAEMEGWDGRFGFLPRSIDKVQR